MKFNIAMFVGLLSLASCGQGSGGETVFFYFLNAYSGADNVSIIGPTGPLVQGAKFGDRMGVASTGVSTPCQRGVDSNGRPIPCIPIEFDRNLGGNFKTVIDGAPAEYDFSRPVFSMYPQETGTVIFAGRTGNGDAVETSLLRHTQSISKTCVLSFVNALSLDNDLTLGEEQFDIIPEFKFDSATQAGYIDEKNSPIPTSCGNITSADHPSEHDQLARDVYATINSDPWFLATECEDKSGEVLGNLCFKWGIRGPDNRALITSGPITLAVRTSAEYFECIKGAVKFVEPSGGVGLGGAAENDKCPADISTADITIDTVALTECKKPKRISLQAIPPVDQGGSRYSIIFFQEPLTCNQQFRMRTPNLDAVFAGQHGNGNLVEINTIIDPGNEYFVVFMGRPVNPVVWRWESGTSIANLNQFPYGNGQDDNVKNP